MAVEQKDHTASNSVQLDHERLTSLINSMADGVIAVDQNAKIVLCNGAALNILNVNTAIQDTSLSEVLKPLDKNEKPVDIVQVVQKTKTPTTNRDMLLKYDDGSTINLYLSISPVHLGYGSIGQRGFVIILRDITHEKSLEEERDEFISVVSHELRTPITIAEGNISNAQFVVDQHGDIEQIKQVLKEAHNQIMFLSDMVNDLSTLSRAERGKLNIEVEPINVHELVKELEDNYSPDAAAKGLQLKIDLSPTLELLNSSKLYVREILQNFITNSIKYTQKGSITIGAKPAVGGIDFWVSDTGIGISKGDMNKIFNKFFRSEDYRTRATSGTGLGLYVTMKLSRLLKAEVKVESELDKGSTFKISIPSQPLEDR